MLERLANLPYPERLRFSCGEDADQPLILAYHSDRPSTPGLQRPPVLHRLRHMRRQYRGRAGQVGDRPGHFEAAVDAAARPAETGGRGVEELRAGVVELALRVDGAAFEGLIGIVLAGEGAFARGDDTAPHAKVTGQLIQLDAGFMLG